MGASLASVAAHLDYRPTLVHLLHQPLKQRVSTRPSVGDIQSGCQENDEQGKGGLHDCGLRTRLLRQCNGQDIASLLDHKITEPLHGSSGS